MLKRAMLRAVRFYQRILSPLKRTPTCRYVPTCSQYAIEAIENRGAIAGTLWALWRLLRCNPLFHGGYHPAPCARHAHEAPRAPRAHARPGGLETRPS